MAPPDIVDRINSFPQWHYQFDLQGHKTPIRDATWINRHRERERYFFHPLVSLLGGTLEGKRVLDLGCNAGNWSLLAAQAGCDFVLGLDGRQMHVDQARFVFEVKGVPPERYDFRRANVYDYLAETDDTFDIVFCLGLLYHVNDPVRLLEGISRLNSDLLLIDTALSLAPGTCLTLHKEPVEDPRNALESTLVLIPTRQAVIDMVRQAGYEVVVLRPAFSDYTGAEDFKDGTRRAFVCSKRTRLEGLSAEEVTPGSRAAEGRRTRGTLKGWFRSLWREARERSDSP